MKTLLYAQILCDEINELLDKGNYKVNARVYKVCPHTPLCMLVFQFVAPDKLAPPQLIESNLEHPREITPNWTHFWVPGDS